MGSFAEAYNDPNIVSVISLTILWKPRLQAMRSNLIIQCACTVLLCHFPSSETRRKLGELSFHKDLWDIITGDTLLSYWPICFPVPSNSSRSLCSS